MTPIICSGRNRGVISEFTPDRIPQLSWEKLLGHISEFCIQIFSSYFPDTIYAVEIVNKVVSIRSTHCHPLTQHHFIAMASGRQKDYTQKAIKGREVQLSVALCSLAKRRQQNLSSIASSSRCLSFFASKIAEHQAEMNKALSRSHRIGLSQFTFNFNSLSDSDCVLYFRLSKANVTRMIYAISWPNTQSHTDRSRYAVSPILATCIILRRLSTPLRWK